MVTSWNYFIGVVYVFCESVSKLVVSTTSLNPGPAPAKGTYLLPI